MLLINKKFSLNKKYLKYSLKTTKQFSNFFIKNTFQKNSNSQSKIQTQTNNLILRKERNPLFTNETKRFFSETKPDLLNIQFIPDPEGVRDFIIKAPYDEIPFDEAVVLTVRAIKELKKRIPNRTILVGIGGASGSGKTTFTEKLEKFFSGMLMISLDNYLDKSKKVIDNNFDDYRLMDFPLLKKNLDDLKEGKSTEMPIYDFRGGGRVGYKTISPPASNVILVEGTYALHHSVRNAYDLTISATGGIHYDLIKRIRRDITRTGQSPQETLEQITETVYPMYKAFIEPDLKFAHIKIRNYFNPFTALLKPIYTLKSDREITFDEIRSSFPDPQSIEVNKEEYNDIYLLPPNEVPNKKLYWIRVRHSLEYGTYTIHFADVFHDKEFLISPTFDFSVSAKVLSGLMGLGYKIDATIHRKTQRFKSGNLQVLVDQVFELNNKVYIQIKGDDNLQVSEMAKKLQFQNHFVNKTYIEIYFEKFQK